MSTLADQLPPVRGRLTPMREMAPLSWLRVGGPAEILFQPADKEDLASFLRALPPDIPVFPVGVCSNLIIRDGAIPVLGASDLVEAVSLVLGPPAPSDSALDGRLATLIGPIGRTVEWIVAAVNRPPGEVLADLARLEASGQIRWVDGLVVGGLDAGGSGVGR